MVPRAAEHPGGAAKHKKQQGQVGKQAEGVGARGLVAGGPGGEVKETRVRVGRHLEMAVAPVGCRMEVHTCPHVGISVVRPIRCCREARKEQEPSKSGAKSQPPKQGRNPVNAPYGTIRQERNSLRAARRDRSARKTRPTHAEQQKEKNSSNRRV